MNHFFQSATRMMSYIGLAFIILAGVLYFAGARFNLTPSIPVGLYWVTQKPIKKGEYVLFCPPQKSAFQEALKRGYINSGWCKGGYGQMMKKVLATSGDMISINSSGVWVNHYLLSFSAPLTQDGHGRKLPSINKAHYTLNPSQLLLMTDQSALSFDARYFGLINQSQVLAVIRPVVTWKSTYHFNE